MKKIVLLIIFFCALSGRAQALSVILPPDIAHTALHKSAVACDAAQAKAELQALPVADKDREINRLDREDYTPLAYAADKGCLDVVKLLVESGAVIDASDEHWRWTPLLRAAGQRHAEVAGYLLAHGANINHRAFSGQTPLTSAIHDPTFGESPVEDRNRIIDLLLMKGADVSLPGRFGRTPVMIAAAQGDTALVQRLIHMGADLSAKDESGKTALDYAGERN